MYGTLFCTLVWCAARCCCADLGLGLMGTGVLERIRTHYGHKFLLPEATTTSSCKKNPLRKTATSKLSFSLT